LTMLSGIRCLTRSDGSNEETHMSFHMVLLIFVAVFTITACQSDSVRLRNPQTGEVAQCGPYGQMSSKTGAATREQCISEYRQQGYEQVR
jgi:hypothetical protein